MTKKHPVDWKKVWKEFNKMMNNFDMFGDSDWRYQKLFLYTLVNTQLPKRKKLTTYNVKRIENQYKNWWRRNNVSPSWPEQRA